MVKLRMARYGRHNDPFYRLVAADSRFARDGRYIEQIGIFNPKNNKANINKELAIKWLSVGAIPSDSVKSLLKKEKILSEWYEQKNKNSKNKKKSKKITNKKHQFNKKTSKIKEVKKEDTIKTNKEK